DQLRFVIHPFWMALPVLHPVWRAFEREGVEAGAGFDAFTLEGAPHGMENWEGHPEWMDYKTKLVEIGRASCRERVEMSEGDVGGKKRAGGEAGRCVER